MASAKILDDLRKAYRACDDPLFDKCEAQLREIHQKHLKGKQMQFSCPKCNGKSLEEIMVGVIVASEVTVSDNGSICYGEQTNEGGDVVQYQCYECGFVLKDEEGNDITDCEDLPDALRALEN